MNAQSTKSTGRYGRRNGLPEVVGAAVIAGDGVTSLVARTMDGSQRARYPPLNYEAYMRTYVVTDASAASSHQPNAPPLRVQIAHSFVHLSLVRRLRTFTRASTSREERTSPDITRHGRLVGNSGTVSKRLPEDRQHLVQECHRTAETSCQPPEGGTMRFSWETQNTRRDGQHVAAMLIRFQRGRASQPLVRFLKADKAKLVSHVSEVLDDANILLLPKPGLGEALLQLGDNLTSRFSWGNLNTVFSNSFHTDGTRAGFMNRLAEFRTDSEDTASLCRYPPTANPLYRR
ncbi:hypothetical protein NM688_g6146 [Phlebia brevispora]|uniref:Uncharacterized protein n=1 Tax=Phlebia brevispora TaxID=194682 RepID=A0ACC1SJH0_9APHY|nr:hypothetical protein NM688_g6146 [Phlebia brevispora]